MRNLILIIVALLLSGGAAAAFAQETPKPQTQTGTSSASQAPARSNIPGKGFYSLLRKKSLFFPNIATSTKRLSTGGKFELFVDNSISLSTISWSALTSSISQAENSPTGFGQGWDAYAKRFGSSMGSQASSEFFGTFVLASALHEDPRFYPEANPSFGHAVRYSVQRVFVTRNDDGRDVANWSALAGPLMAEGLANVYWPDRNRTVGDTFLRYGLDLATRAGGNLFREYWPVFYRKIHHEAAYRMPSRYGTVSKSSSGTAERSSSGYRYACLLGVVAVGKSVPDDLGHRYAGLVGFIP